MPPARNRTCTAPSRCPRGRIYDSVLETVGAHAAGAGAAADAPRTGCVADLALKLEFFNPLGSVKDRIGLGDDRGRRARGRDHARARSMLVEPTRGNTGIALAFVAAAQAATG